MQSAFGFTVRPKLKTQALQEHPVAITGEREDKQNHIAVLKLSPFTMLAYITLKTASDSKPGVNGIGKCIVYQKGKGHYKMSIC